MESRLSDCLKTKNYYEYDQVLRTIFFKYKIKKRTQDLQKLVRRGMEELATEGQKELVTDLLDLYFNEFAKKLNIADDYLIETAGFAFKNGEVKKSIKVLEKIIEYTPQKSRGLAKMIGDHYFEEGVYT
mmetsp:Transcript_33937/g.25009  ORF Transcript_33937/g.25009 Transcript_33937/m.25009 type:complete len:129 (-) Transcript_33937:2723-3109(-)